MYFRNGAAAQRRDVVPHERYIGQPAAYLRPRRLDVERFSGLNWEGTARKTKADLPVRPLLAGSVGSRARQ